MSAPSNWSGWGVVQAALAISDSTKIRSSITNKFFDFDRLADLSRGSDTAYKYPSSLDLSIEELYQDYNSIKG